MLNQTDQKISQTSRSPKKKNFNKLFKGELPLKNSSAPKQQKKYFDSEANPDYMSQGCAAVDLEKIGERPKLENYENLYKLQYKAQ